MPKRDYKISGQNRYFHLFNRGNNHQDIFLDNEDYEFFKLKLKQNLYPDTSLVRMRPLPEGSFTLYSYCLMPNHFHLLLKQNNKYSVQQLILRVCTSYSKYFNKKYTRVGHVFQDRFKQIDIDDNKQLLWLYAYINLNPVLDKITNKPEKYQWSSFHEILSGYDDLCDLNFIRTEFKDKTSLVKFFKEALPVLKINKRLRHLHIE